jgi:hypothetical protein
MLTILKLVGAAAWSVLLLTGLGLSDVALSSEKMSDKESAKIIKGTVLRSEGPNYFVKNKEDGKEVRLRIDKNTQMNALGIVTGDNVIAKVDDQNHIESISTDENAGQHVAR